jgi:hypothetical protein
MLKWMIAEGYGDKRTIARRIAKVRACYDAAREKRRWWFCSPSCSDMVSSYRVCALWCICRSAVLRGRGEAWKLRCAALAVRYLARRLPTIHVQSTVLSLFVKVLTKPKMFTDVQCLLCAALLVCTDGGVVGGPAAAGGRQGRQVLGRDPHQHGRHQGKGDCVLLCTCFVGQCC